MEAIKSDKKMMSLLSHYDSSIGVTPIVNKLPHYMQEKWTSSAVKYMKDKNVVYPPFTHFAEFLRDQSRIRNNPSFLYESTAQKKANDIPKHSDKNPYIVHVKKTSATQTQENQIENTASNISSELRKCPLHHTDHVLNKCRFF